MTDLNKRERAILKFIEKQINEKGYPPSVREICAGLGLSSPATVHTHLKQLELKGAISKTKSKFRTIEVTGENEYMPKNGELVKVPLLGKITAGTPIEAIEQPNEFFTLPANLIPAKETIFTLKVSGESMINAGILDGDIIIVQKQKVARNGEIVVAMTEENKDSEEVKQFNHSYYQGLLLTIGNFRNLKTFVPNQDQNKLYGKQKLGDLRTLQVLPNFSYNNFVHRSSTIDVIWFNERNMPDSFFEVEHSTDIQNSLLKFNDLRDFYVRMVIVADERRKQEYLSKINYSSFEILNKEKRVHFLSYSQLEEEYNQELKKQEFEFVL